MPSNVWKYFKKVEKNVAQCNVCAKKLQTGGGTSNLRQHMTIKHGEKIEEPQALPESPSFQPKRQMTLFESVERTSSFDKGGKREKELTDALIFMICKDNAPHSIVKKEGFQKFSKTAVPLYKLPSRNTVTQMVSSRYEAIMHTVSLTMQNVDYFCLTTDICTITNTSKSFLVVTAHFICPDDNVLQTVMLGARRMLECHTADYVATTIQHFMELFKIARSKTVAIATDGGANMVAGVRKLLGEGRNVRCLAHILNLIVTDALEEDALKEIIGDVKVIVKYAKHSNIFMDSLRSEQLKEGKAEGNILTPIQSVLTRWNSTFYMLERFIQLCPYIGRVLANPCLKKGPRMLTASEIELLTEILNILRPFEQATLEISGSEYFTGSLVIPLVSCISTAMKEANATHEISKQLLNKLQKNVMNRSENIFNNSLLCRATLLDPRFKKMYFSAQIANETIAKISEEVSVHSKDIGKGSPPSVIAGSFNNTLWKTHDTNFTKSISEVSPSNFHSELKLYLQQPPILRSSNPLEFWKQSMAFMPALSPIALKYLTVIGSSVPSERLVSILNDIISDERSRLTDQHISERLFLNRVDKKYWKI